MNSDLYGEHDIDGATVDKPTVINFSANRALTGKILIVYELGMQARDFVHTRDVAQESGVDISGARETLGWKGLERSDQ